GDGIEDVGPGTRPEDLDRIFDAFFTTKPPGAGTGLGLAISHRIVTVDHRGDLTVESVPGRTVFRASLPPGEQGACSGTASPELAPPGEAAATWGVHTRA